jgi:hypothetical protein
MISGIESAECKVKRAQKHLRALKLRSTRYTGDESNLVIDESENTKKLHFPNEPPIDIAILAGEIVYQLRSALNHLAFELVKSNHTGAVLPPKWGRKCQFPLCLKVPTHGNPAVPWALPLPFNFFRDSLPCITAKAFAEIERLQPYNGGNGPTQLGWLEQLANIDKHHHFHVVVPQAYQTEHIRSATIDSERILRLQDGAEIKPMLHEPGEFQGTVYVERGVVSPFLSFDEEALTKDLADVPIDNVLELCVDALDRVVIPKLRRVIMSP